MARESSDQPLGPHQEAARPIELCVVALGDESKKVGETIESSLRPRQPGHSKRNKFIELLKLLMMLMNLAFEAMTVSNALCAVDIILMLLRNAPLITGCIKKIQHIVSSSEGRSHTSPERGQGEGVERKKS